MRDSMPRERFGDEPSAVNLCHLPPIARTAARGTMTLRAKYLPLHEGRFVAPNARQAPFELRRGVVFVGSGGGFSDVDTPHQTSTERRFMAMAQRSATSWARLMHTQVKYAVGQRSTVAILGKTIHDRNDHSRITPTVSKS